MARALGGRCQARRFGGNPGGCSRFPLRGAVTGRPLRWPPGRDDKLREDSHRFGGRTQCAAVTWRFCASAWDSSFTQSRGLLRSASADRGATAEASTLGSGWKRNGRALGVSARGDGELGCIGSAFASCFGTMWFSRFGGGASQGHGTSNGFPLCRFTRYQAVVSATRRHLDAPSLRRRGGSTGRCRLRHAVAAGFGRQHCSRRGASALGNDIGSLRC